MACFLQAGGDVFQLGFEFFLGRQVELIFGGENFAVGREREFNQGIVFTVAEEDADGGGLVGQLHMPIEIIDIHLHLAEVLVREFVALEVDEDIAAEEAVVENEVDSEVVVVEGEAFLAGFEEKALTEFEKEGFELVDDGGFEIGFRVAGVVGEAEEFENKRIFNKVGGFFDDLSFAGQAANFVLVSAEGEALVERAGDLALELAHAPLVGGSLDLVETTLFGDIDREQLDIVRPSEREAVQESNGQGGWFEKRFLLR